MKKHVVIMIPARFASVRFPGKPLVPLKGETGVSKSLIERTWDAAVRVDNVDAVYVLTDDQRIKDAAESFGADVLMTSSTCLNGTERVAEALSQLAIPPDIVINIQGDAPLTPHWYIDALIEAMSQSPTSVATPVLRCSGAHLDQLKADRKAGRVGGTTAIFDEEMNAIYFSKEVVPFVDQSFDHDTLSPVFHHVGVYAYTRQALAQYRALSPGRLETLEGLEQLRFLEHGVKVACVEVEDRGRLFWELNNPADVAIIEGILAKEGLS